MSPLDYLWVGLAGSAGTVLRFVVDGTVTHRVAGRLPLGTMAVNVSGSLLLGFVVGLVVFRGQPALWQTVAGTGFCGGYTTFSTASFETVRLTQAGAYGAALVTGTGTLLLTVGAGALGLLLSQV